MPFEDQFSGQADSYARARPTYPDALLDAVAGFAPGRHLAWDCAAGSGQASVGLARRFEQVLATDAAVAPLARFPRGSECLRAAALSERSPLRDGSTDLVTVAQALHWFDLEPFFAEVERVLRPGGALAVWCYTLIEVDAEIDPVVRWFYDEVVGPFWLPGRELVDRGYAGVALPFGEAPAPRFTIDRRLRLVDLVGYVETWSAVQRYRRQVGRDPLPLLDDALAPAWGDASVPRTVRWPIALRVAVKPPR